MSRLTLQPFASPTSTRPASSYSFSAYLPSSSSGSASPGHVSDGDDDDLGPLPFPTALARRDFLAPDFDAATYLSNLHTGPTARHQTLEDLRSELRDRSAAISNELLELVNSNYTAFLELGSGLKGGEERVEDVRVALLGFRRAVEEVQTRVREKRVEVKGHSDELGRVRAAVESGRRMLELEERVVGLEERLTLDSLGGGAKKHAVNGTGNGEEHDWDVDAESEDDEEASGESSDAHFVGSSPAKLKGLAREYLLIQQLAESIGRDVAFVKKMGERMLRCRNTILLDLSTALKEAKRAGAAGQARVVAYMGLYGTLDAQTDAVRVLRES